MTELSALHVKITGDASGLSAAMSDAERSTKGLSKAADDAAESTRKITPSADGASKAIDDLGESADKAGRETLDLSKEIDAAAIASEGLRQASENASKATGKLAPASKTAGQSLSGTSTATSGLSSAFGRLSNLSGDTKNKIQNMGYQVQDLAIQLQGGVSAATAFSQQGSQMLGIFGPVGAVLGTLAAVGIPLLSAAFASSGAKAATFSDEMDKAGQALGRVESAATRAQRAISSIIAVESATNVIKTLGTELDGTTGKFVTLFGASSRAGAAMVEQFNAISKAPTAAGQLAELEAMIIMLKNNTAGVKTWSEKGQEFYGKLQDAAVQLRNTLEEQAKGPETTGEREQAERTKTEQAATEAKLKALQDSQRAAYDVMMRGFLDEEALVRDNYQRQLDSLQEFLDKKSITETEYNEARKQAEIEKNEALAAIRQADIDAQLDEMDRQAQAEREYINQSVRANEEAQRKIQSVRQGATDAAVDLLGVLGQKNKAFAIASIALTKGLAIAQTLARSAEASILAYSSQLVPGDPTSIARAEAARNATLTMGKITAGLIAATGLAQAASVGGGGGGATAAASTAGATTAAGTTTTAEPSVSRNVAIQLTGGDMFSRDSVLSLINQINEAVEDGAMVRVV